MRKILLIAIVSLFALNAVAQRKGEISKLTDVDSLVVIKYNTFNPQLDELANRFSQATDENQKNKIEEQYNATQAKLDAEVVAIYTKYANIDGVAQRLFLLRAMFDKKQLQKIYSKLPAHIKESDPYAKSIIKYIESYQVGVGDEIGDFRATTSKKYQFSYNEFKNEKDVLLIFGSMNSFELNTRVALMLAYKNVDVSKLEFISVYNASSFEDFAKMSDKDGVEWLAISDLKGDHSSLNMSFNVYAEPTFIYISKGGYVEAISHYLNDTINKLINSNGFN